MQSRPNSQFDWIGIWKSGCISESYFPSLASPSDHGLVILRYPHLWVADDLKHNCLPRCRLHFPSPRVVERFISFGRSSSSMGCHFMWRMQSFDFAALQPVSRKRDLFKMIERRHSDRMAAFSVSNLIVVNCICSVMSRLLVFFESYNHSCQERSTLFQPFPRKVDWWEHWPYKSDNLMSLETLTMRLGVCMVCHYSIIWLPSSRFNHDFLITCSQRRASFPDLMACVHFLSQFLNFSCL
jgi:hypothetical protein